jgi:hypothetical protein
VEDPFGNVVTSNRSRVTVSVSSPSGRFATGTATTAKAASGVATFSKLIFDTAGTYTLRVSDGALTGATTSVTVSPAAARKLVLTQKPSAATAGQALSPGLAVAVEDAFGNVVASNTSTVTISISSGPGGFVTGSTTSVAAVNGVATFNNLVLGKAGSYALKASDGLLTKVTSPSIRTAAASPSQLVITQAPTAGTAGQSLGTALKVAVKDAYGNVVTTNASNMSIAVNSGPGSFAAAGSTMSVTAVGGVATFSNLILDTAGSYTLSVSDGSLTGATTGNVTVSAAAPAKLAFIQIPSSTPGSPLSLIEVAVEDKFGNIASAANLDVTLTVYSGPGPFESGSTTVLVPVKGVANFSKLMLAPGTYTLKATDGSLPAAISTQINIA